MNFSAILVIAKNLLLESIRERTYSISVVIALLLFGLSAVFGSMSFGEESRVLAHFGWLGILLSGLALAVFFASPYFHKELSKQTLLVVLARPITRSSYYLGAWCGLMSLLLLSTFSLSALLYLLLPTGIALSSYAVVVIGIFCEQLIVLSLGLMLSLHFKPTLAGTLTMSVYLMGHWQQDLKFFMKGLDNVMFQGISLLVDWGVPALHQMNFRSIYFLSHPVATSQLIWILVHTAAWVTLLNALGVALFRRRDLV